MSLWSQIANVFRGDRLDREIEEELRSHIDEAIQEGREPAEARGAFGPALLLREESRDIRILPWLDALRRDVSGALRGMRRSPGFATAAVAYLALGIGANAAIFSIIDRVLLRPLPYQDADRLVSLMRTFRNSSARETSIPKFNLWKTAASLQFVSAYDFEANEMNLFSGSLPERVRAIHVSEDYFRLFGVSTSLGRTFTRQEDSPGGPAVAIIGYGLWTRRFGGDRGLPGRSILLNSEPYTVIGIMGPGFEGEPQADVFIPLQPDTNSASQGHNLLVGGRMGPGATLEQVNAEMKVVAEKFRRIYPRSMAPDESVGALSMRELAVRKVRRTLLVLLGAVAFVLLIACANVANLLLVRSVARGKEIAVRVAIGAGRIHIFRQLLTESTILSLLGGLIGVLLGILGLRVLLSLAPGDLPRMPEAERMSALALLDGRVLLFVLGVSLLTGILFGLVPALKISRPDLGPILREGGVRTTGGAARQTSRSALVVAEIALSLVLLVGAGLMIRTFVAVRSVKPGFDVNHVLTMRTSLAGKKYDAASKMETLIHNMEDRFESLPGVQAAAFAFNLPIEGGPNFPFSIVGRAPPRGNPYEGAEQYRMVSRQYFLALGIPLRRGRLFSGADSSRGVPVAIVNEAFAKKYWPKEHSPGASIIIGHGMGPEFEDKPRLIVGIVGDVRENGLGRELPPVCYIPVAQAPDGIVARSNRFFPSSWILRTSGDPSALARSAQREMLKVDPQLPVSAIESMARIVSKSTASQNFNMLLLGIFAGIAALLAITGIYAVMAYSVAQRTNEIGIRMALGAKQMQVARLIIGHGLLLAVIGVTIGLGAAYGLTRLLKSMLFGVTANDPATLIVASAALIMAALGASFIPACRAARVDPIVALRFE